MLKVFGMIAACTIALSPVGARADTPPQPPVSVPSAHALALASQYFDAIHYDKTIQGVMAGLMPVMTDQFRSIPGLTAAQNKAFMDSFTETMPVMMDKMLPMLREKSIPVLARIFTEEELTQMVGFYASPVGQSIIAKTPQFSAAISGDVRAMMPGLVSDMTAELLNRFCSKTDCNALPGGRAKLDSLFGRSRS